MLNKLNLKKNVLILKLTDFLGIFKFISNMNLDKIYLKNKFFYSNISVEIQLNRKMFSSGKHQLIYHINQDINV